MNILVTNDDGIFAPGLWALVKELKSIARVVVVAPDREQSATGTAVTLRQPLRVQRVKPMIPDVETYSVEGTPSDSVLLALGKLVSSKIDMVISGINLGANLGDDVLISGTVSAALQGYLRGFPALAVSLASRNGSQFDSAASLATLLAKKISQNGLTSNILLNVNVPALPLDEIKGIQITCTAHQSHIDTVKEGHDGLREYYWLVRQQISKDAANGTDIWAIENGNISITPLYNNSADKSLFPISDVLCYELLQELRDPTTGVASH